MWRVSGTPRQESGFGIGVKMGMDERQAINFAMSIEGIITGCNDHIQKAPPCQLCKRFLCGIHPQDQPGNHARPGGKPARESKCGECAKNQEGSILPMPQSRSQKTQPKPR